RERVQGDDAAGVDLARSIPDDRGRAHVIALTARAAPGPRALRARGDYSRRMASAPSSIGRYRIIDVLGTGTTGVVYRAEDPNAGRLVAIKVIARELASDETFRRRFQREATATAALVHPNVVGIHGVLEDHGLSAIVLEYVEGGSLRARLERG